jgi:hypothetical protein
VGQAVCIVAQSKLMDSAFRRPAPPVLTALRRVPRPAASHVAGPVKAVIFDWAGTIVDHGSTAPVQAFIEAFKRFGDVTIDAVSNATTAWVGPGTLPPEHHTA